MCRRDQKIARAEQLFRPKKAGVEQQEDRRLTAIKRALGLLRKGGLGPFACAQVAQKAAECSGSGISVPALNVFMSNMSDAQRHELEGMGLAPRYRTDESCVRTLGTDDSKTIEMRYLSVIHGLAPEQRTPQNIAGKLKIAVLCVQSYLFANPEIGKLVVRGPLSP